MKLTFVVLILVLAVVVLSLIAWDAVSQAQGPLFVPGTPVSVGPGSGEVFLVDLNRDGHLDLLTKHLLSRTLSVRLGDGAGEFRPISEGPMTLDYQPGTIALGDINNDAILDLGVASREKEREKELVHILLGTGTGGFSEVSGSPHAVSSYFELYKPMLAFVDVDEDGKADIVTANGRRNRVEILLGDGRGGFSSRREVALEPGGDFYTFALGDVDGDGHADLVATSSSERARGDGRLWIKRGDGKGTFADSRRSVTLALEDPRVAAVADVNGDGHADLVLTDGRSPVVQVLVNRGNGTFTRASRTSHRVDGEANRIVVADVDRDGRKDLVAATVNSVSVLLGARDGFVPAPGSPFRAGPGAYNVAAGDLNGDGKIDLAASSFEGDAITILLGR